MKTFNTTEYQNLDVYIKSLREYKFDDKYNPKFSELFEYSHMTTEEKDDFRKEYIHEDIYWAEKHHEWDWIIEEPIQEVYQFPFLSDNLCLMFIKETENFNQWLGQHSGPNKHSSYTTTDTYLTSIPDRLNSNNTPLKDLYIDLQQKYVCPIMDKVWKWYPNHWDNPFVAKYSSDEQSFVEPHHDESVCATIVTLNDDYEGGGTYFEKQKKLVEGKIGWCTMHPSKLTHRHGSKRVTKGKRYILVNFIGK